jgi:hypothetical protein
MFPAGFDQDGQMFSNTRFGDFPQYLPAKKWMDKDELFAGWMLLSYQKPANASSTLDTMRAAKVTDENPRTFWVSKNNNSGEWIIVDLQKESEVKSIQVNYTDYKSDIFSNDPNKVYTQFRLYASPDGKNWTSIADLTHEKRDRPNAYIELKEPVKARWIKYEHVYVASPNLAISDIRVFGRGQGSAPKIPTGISAVRDHDPRNAVIKWTKVKGAVGYNIRWGIAPGKLYQTYQIWADQPATKEIRALNTGVSYYFAVEAFNENGVSPLSELVGIR